MSKLSRRVILFGSPLFAGIVNFFHPVHFESTGTYDAIQGAVNRWMAVHVLNLADFALIGLAAFLIIKERSGAAATLAKISLAAFVPLYLAFDAVVGIGTGLLVQITENLPTEQLATAKSIIDDFWAASNGSILPVVGSILWSFSMAMIAVAFNEPKRRTVMVVLGLLAGGVDGWGYSASTFGTPVWWAVVLAVALIAFVLGQPGFPSAFLLLASMLFGITHVVPFGPLGMLCFLLGAAWLEFRPAFAEAPQQAGATT